MKFLIMFLFSSTAYAAGAGGPSDLIPSMINIVLLIGLLTYLLKDTLKSHFKTKSEEIASKVERASAKAKEAKFMMEREQKKMSAVDAEIASLETDVKTQLSQFETDYKNSIEARKASLKTDAAMKIEAEKKDLLDDLNSKLLDNVIAKSRNILESNPELNTEAARKMIEGLK